MLFTDISEIGKRITLENMCETCMCNIGGLSLNQVGST